MSPYVKTKCECHEVGDKVPYHDTKKNKNKKNKKNNKKNGKLWLTKYLPHLAHLPFGALG